MTKEKNSKLNSPEMSFHKHYQIMWPYVKPYTIRALLAILICIPIGALDSVVALSLKPYMDVVLVNKSEGSPAYIPLLIVGFTSVQGFLNYLATYLNTWVGTKINHDLKRAMYKKLLFLETRFFDTCDSGTILQRFSSDTDIACSGLLDNLKLFVSRLFSSLSLICVLIYNSWQLSIIAIVVLLFALLPLSTVKRRIKNVVLRNVEEASKISTNYNETFGGNKTISAYNLQKHMYNQFNDTLNQIFKLIMKVVQRTGWMTPLMHIIVSIGIGAVIGYGSYLIVNGTITSGSFVSFITALILLYTPIKGIGKNFNNVQVSFLAIERVAEILAIEPSIKDIANPQKMNGVNKDIVFDNVWFEYNENCPVLKGISFTAKAGQTTALVGNSGGGKSTIVNLLPRFYDTKSGEIYIDGTDIKSFSLEDLRNNIAVVFQDNFLFSGTIRQNLLFGKENATDEELHHALKMAYLDEFVSELEHGIDTQIGERGTLLSGGQRQRLAIARAFLKDSPIVILDEATSALDNKTEALVQKAIDNLMKNKTVFVIAHRLSTIQNADNILVLNDGQIVEQGTHEDLLKVENGIYRSLYNAQFKNAA